MALSLAAIAGIVMAAPAPTVAQPLPAVNQPPTITITRPGTSIVASTFVLGGRASDDLAVRAARVSLRGLDDRYWNGRSWQTQVAWLRAKLASPGERSTTWSLKVSAPVGSRFFATAMAVDQAGATGQQLVSLNVGTPPNLLVNAFVVGPFRRGGTAAIGGGMYNGGQIAFSGSVTLRVVVPASVTITGIDQAGAGWASCSHTARTMTCKRSGRQPDSATYTFPQALVSIAANAPDTVRVTSTIIAPRQESAGDVASLDVTVYPSN
jgi:hypothetical protein